MLITLVRHAEVEKEYQHKYNGHIDISLSAQGKKQALELAQRLQHSSYDAIFSSDLKRCRQTLECFDLQQKPVYTSMLREKSWGRHEGKSFDEIIQMEPFGYESFEQWINALDGEDYGDYIQRVENFFTRFLPAAAPYDHILVMTHAGVIRVLMHVLEKISLEEAFSRSFAYADHTILDTKSWSFIKNDGGVKCV